MKNANKLRKLGYIISYKKGIDIYEPFTSDITGKKMKVSVGFASYKEKDKQEEFLAQVYKNITIK